MHRVLRLAVEATGRPAPFMSPCGGLLAPAFLLYFTAPVTRQPRQQAGSRKGRTQEPMHDRAPERCGRVAVWRQGARLA